MTAREWLCEQYGAKIDDNFSICYRPYENGSLVQAINIDTAVEMFEEDLKEDYKFMCCFDMEDKTFEHTCAIWKKHLVIW